MFFIFILIFLIGYIFIIFESFFKLNKTPVSLLIGILSWMIIAIFNVKVYDLDSLLLNKKCITMEKSLLYHFGKASEIITFLTGAMIIVEIIDYFNGFDYLKEIIYTRSKIKLLWILSFLIFFLSSLIDNMTSIIVLATFLKKILKNKQDRLYYISVLVISANAGGAWSPIGDLTTTMLWISNKVTSLKLVKNIFMPSLLSMIVPLFIFSFYPIFQGYLDDCDYDSNDNINNENGNKIDKNISFMILYIGIFLILLVPIFKTITHTPPYISMLFSLSIMWIITDIINNIKLKNINNKYCIKTIISRIDFTSVLFFLGILLSISALEATGGLMIITKYINSIIPNQSLFIIIFGIISSVIDNVPLVAASMGMFFESLDSNIWHFIAYVTGTGGSLLIIGSAAGVAAMGIEKIRFLWYLKNISLVALVGYLSGCIYITYFIK